ncbi:MAG TPA: hypothetical protein VH597_02685 [Verrucomicrobiae bacterium]|nr:hypothetical protein [Verrucomicrobiae bacterium]
MFRPVKTLIVDLLLSPTNLALSPMQWTSIATNSFNNSGAFTFTATQDPNAQQLYYLLQTP